MGLHHALPLPLIGAIAAVHAMPTPATAADDELIVRQSDFDVTKTLDRLGIALERKGMKVSTRLNHAKGAASFGMDLAPNAALISVSPKTGTPLMTFNQAIGLDVPLKAVVWKAADGTVKLPYTDPVILAKHYGIEGRAKVFEKIAGALNKFTDMATKRRGLPKQ